MAKLQFEDQSVRVRIDEDELARLLAGQLIASATRFNESFALCVTLVVAQLDAPFVQGTADEWQIGLPLADVRALAARLPTRDGLQYRLHGLGDYPLDLRFDVDVRDSARRLCAARS